MQNSCGLVIIFSPIQSLEERSGKKGAASQVEQRMKDEQCWSDVADEAKVGEKEKRELEVDG